MRTNNLPLAEEFFNKAKAICPEDPLIYNELGTLAHARKNYAHAARCFKKALALLPHALNVTWEATVSNLAHALRKSGKYREALGMYEKALALAPKRAGTYAAMGYTLHLLGRQHEAIELCVMRSMRCDAMRWNWGVRSFRLRIQRCHHGSLTHSIISLFLQVPQGAQHQR